MKRQLGMRVQEKTLLLHSRGPQVSWPPNLAIQKVH